MRKIIALLIIAALLAGCTSPLPPPLPTPRPTAEPIAAASPTPIASPAPTDTPIPTETPTEAPTQAPTDTPEPDPADEYYEIIEGMSDEELIGQLLMFGFNGTDEVPSSFADFMEDAYIGGIVLFGVKNTVRDDSDGGFSRARQLISDIKAHNGSALPLFIALDVEGGKVTRFRWERSLYSAQRLGDMNDGDTAYEQFLYIAQGLVELGVNMNLAPVMDVAKNPSKTFLGNRIISDDAQVASRIGVECIRGLHDGGCLSVVKHFPGHGATTSDTHAVTPVVDKDLYELEEYELIPFDAAIAAGVDGVMVGHILYPELDSYSIASLSPVMIGELLRGRMGFDGLVMSDSFTMDGLTDHAPVGEAAVRFVLAGGDLILCGVGLSVQKEIVSALVAAVKDGTITRERLEESALRIALAKARTESR